MTSTYDTRTTSRRNIGNNFVLGVQNVRSICVQGRLANVTAEIQTHDIDILCLTETWLRQNDVLPDVGFSHAGLNYTSWPRTGRARGGGLAIIYRNAFSLKEITFQTFESFEHVTVSLMCRGCSIGTLSVIYRPPSEPISLFMKDFDDFLERLCTSNASNLLVVGDFNIHMNDTNHCYTKRFFQLIHQYDLCQFVHSSTHIAGHTIDLVLARESENLINSVSVHDYGISDHFLVLCNVNSVINEGCDVIYRDVRD